MSMPCIDCMWGCNKTETDLVTLMENAHRRCLNPIRHCEVIGYHMVGISFLDSIDDCYTCPHFKQRTPNGERVDDKGNDHTDSELLRMCKDVAKRMGYDEKSMRDIGIYGLYPEEVVDENNQFSW